MPQRVRSRRASAPTTLRPLLVSRLQTAGLLGYTSIDPVVEIERSGKLTPVRPTGRPRGQVFYSLSQVEKVAAGD